MHKGIMMIVKAESAEDARGIIESGLNENDYGNWYDWYQVGGRWTGTLDDYNPEKDPENIETCSLCHGSGMRNDDVGQQLRAENPEYKCNGCKGDGKSLKWPTAWVKHDGDVLPLSECIEIVRKWAETEDRIIELQERAQDYIAGGDFRTAGYMLKTTSALMCQDFCDECNVFNVEKYDYTVPEDVTNYYVVIVDFHN